MQRNASVWRKGGVQQELENHVQYFWIQWGLRRLLKTVFKIERRLWLHVFAALPFQTHNILVFMSGLSKISLGEKSDTERVKKFSWHTAQKVSIPKIQCEWPMQLLLLFLETCTYSWAVCNKKSLESSGKWWTIKLFLCFFMLFPGMSSCFCLDYLQLRIETKKTKSSLRVWVS